MEGALEVFNALDNLAPMRKTSIHLMRDHAPARVVNALEKYAWTEEEKKKLKEYINDFRMDDLTTHPRSNLCIFDYSEEQLVASIYAAMICVQTYKRQRGFRWINSYETEALVVDSEDLKNCDLLVLHEIDTSRSLGYKDGMVASFIKYRMNNELPIVFVPYYKRDRFSERMETMYGEDVCNLIKLTSFIFTVDPSGVLK